jgi:hypothetical protein
MEVSGMLLAPAVLPPGKESPVPIGWDAVVKRNTPAPARNWVPIIHLKSITLLTELSWLQSRLFYVLYVFKKFTNLWQTVQPHVIAEFIVALSLSAMTLKTKLFFNYGYFFFSFLHLSWRELCDSVGKQ